MNYRREIDGLRALAVLPVILFHAGFETFSGGFVGVDVFFVISGYLITTIILAELEQGKFSIVNFYERRARRILPALFLVMLVCIPFAWFWLLPSDMKDFSQSLVAVSLFVANIFFWLESGYFAPAAELKPLLHTWSLAVEEQFYLLFPVFLMFFWKFGRTFILVMFSLIFLLSLAIADWASYVMPSAAFYLLPTRGWELLIGSFAAFYFRNPRRPITGKILGEVGGLLGVILICLAIFIYTKNTPFPGLYALVPTLGALLIILFANQKNYVGRFLGNKFFVGLGLISYSAYLWHQPLFAFARHKGITDADYFVFLILSFVSLLLAYVSWKFVETPLRNKQKFSRASIFTLGGGGIILFVVLGSYGVSNNGFVWRFPVYTEVLSKLQWSEENNITQDCKSLFGGDQYCRITNPTVAPTDILIGDSHANHFFPGLSHYLEKKDRNLLMFGAGACPPFIEIDMGFHYVHGVKLRCYERTSNTYIKLLKSNSIKNVFLSFTANGYLDSKIEFNDLRGEIDFSLDRDKAILNGILRTVKMAQMNSKRVFVIQDLPDVSFGSFKKCLRERGNLENSIQCLRLENIDPRYLKILDELSLNGVEVIRTEHLLSRFPFTTKGDLMYRDNTHLSESGSLYFGENLRFND
jgi:peptidoglycan/LPS O-acetylase OafA/YrhL